MNYLNIRKKWIAVKFLPMQTDYEHKKIQYKMGKDGAPEEAAARMKILEMDYKRWANELDGLGYNGKVFDLEVKRVANIKPVSNEEEQVHALVKNRQTGRAGPNYKMGIIIANAPSLTKACQNIKE